MTSLGIDLDQYRVQAKDLLKQVRTSQPAAIDRIRASHPEHDALIGAGILKLADAQLVVARENGFPSWARFKSYLGFRKALAALDAGDIRTLDAAIAGQPNVLGYRCRTGEWYEQGYFAGATLLHHVAGNPIRCPLPHNVVDAARLLLDRGADPNAKTDEGWTTVGLVLTGKQPSDAGVSVPLIDLLIDHGASRDEVDDEDVLTLPLLNSGRQAAEALVRRGARMDLGHAAGLGRIEAMREMLARGQDKDRIEEALVYAAVQNEDEAARLLVRHGARGDVLASPGRRSSALHEAANRGHVGIVRLLLENGADLSVRDAQFDGTPAGWAAHAGQQETLALLEQARAQND